VRFFYFENRTNKLYLDGYTLYTRKSKRHKWEVVKIYRRSSWNSRGYFAEAILTIDQVPFTEEIKKEALDNFVKEIEVCLWTKN
jgi:hypothetical protein